MEWVRDDEPGYSVEAIGPSGIQVSERMPAAMVAGFLRGIASNIEESYAPAPQPRLEIHISGPYST